ncbi:MAG TPA: FHA domain-containing protein, partial [Chthonomonadales bacterium]|nr:FHA domain-containing protein [Chthonomonadales bacterium]
GADAGMAAFARQVISRAFGWAFMGLGIGAGSAIATRSPKRITHGAIGGFLGGFAGGFIFDILAVSWAPVQQVAAGGPRTFDSGGLSRLVGFTAIGALSGLFIGLVEELMKQAWVRVLAGRNEGADFILSRPMNIIGRDERSDVPLYGDGSVALQHAAIRADGHRHVLIDGGARAGTIVNGQQVPSGTELLLRDGDMIQIGSRRILFREKATAIKVSRPVDIPATSPTVPALVPSHLCPYCGAVKDASGSCLCSLAGNSAATVSFGQSAFPPAAMPNFPAPAPSPSVGALTAPAGPGRLVGLGGAYAGQIFLLPPEGGTVGRDPSCVVALPGDSTVSRHHAQFISVNGAFLVQDIGSSNGTYVNSSRVTDQPLRSGDIVQFGASQFRFEG